MEKSALMEFSVCTLDFAREWKRCNMVANYLAAYTSYQFSQKRETTENLISSLTNEVLEALTLVAPPDSRLDIRVLPRPGMLVIDFSHDMKSGYVLPWLEFFDILDKSLDDLFYLPLLSGTREPEPGFNQLGLSMLVHDFGARISTVQNPGSREFTTTVQVPVEGLNHE